MLEADAAKLRRLRQALKRIGKFTGSRIKMKLKMDQRKKNIVLYVFSILLIGIALVLFSSKDSMVELNETVLEGIELLKTPNQLRNKYSSQESYLVALEGQLLVSFERESDKLNEDIKFYENMFSVLLLVGGIQFFVLILPTRELK